MSEQLAAVFLDVDKTTVDGRGRLYDGLEEALDPASRQFAFSSVTARGYPRYCEAITDNPALASTPGLPVALENGGRIVDGELTENIEYYPFSSDELAAICDYIATTPGIRYVGFHGKTLRAKTQLWSPNPQEVTRMRAEWSHNAEPFGGALDDLFRSMRAHEPCLVISRVIEGVPENLPAGITAYGHGSTVNFVPGGVDKGRAVATMADLAGLSLQEVLYGGNDANDLPALALPGLGCGVAVGPDITPDMLAALPPTTVHLERQQQLGGFLVGRFGK
jgi:hydroxymethylpyrimidine pyrophosphatase-like HAD family hydrolase